VKQIATERLPDLKLLGVNVSLDVADIRTTGESKFRAECAANIPFVTTRTSDGSRNQSIFPITYHVERTIDGKLYVSVFGL
jgi:hypothetical protein